MNHTNSERLVGWVPESSGRGTLTLISTCLFTVFVCTWTVIHPRVHTNPHLKKRHKVAQLVKTILAPEMVLLESLQEWIQARKMIKHSATATSEELNLVQAFYIGMLGVRYRTGQGHKVLWPSQYAWLLNAGLVKWGDHSDWGLDIAFIKDKSNADGFAKLITISQVSWFVAQSVTRVAKDLPISPIESMAIAYVFVALLTYIFWWKKPNDIGTANFICLPPMNSEQQANFELLAMETTYDEERGHRPSNGAAWYLVARDLNDEEKELLSQPPVDGEKAIPQSETESNKAGAQIDRLGDLESGRSPSQSKLRAQPKPSDAPDPLVVTRWDRSLYMSPFWPLICILGSAFGAIHLISWHSDFPTYIGLWLWRTSALVSVLTSIIFMQFEIISLRWDGPLTMIRVGSLLLHIISRFVMIVQVSACLRKTPMSVYEAPNIWSYWIHFS